MKQPGKNKDTKNDKWIEDAWKAHSPQIYNLCRMSCESSEDAKDVFQNIALRFFKCAKSIKYGDSVFPWLFRVFRNCFYDYVRFRQKMMPFSIASDVVGDYMALPAESSVFYREGNQKNDDLMRVVNSLSRSDRELIDMTFHKGLSTEELSALYGVSFSAITKRRKSAIKRARNVLLG